mgnify:FL=1
MKSKTLDFLTVVSRLILVGLVGLFVLAFGFEMGKGMTERVEETTTAKPIYQQQIGDDTEPDILIIYEAEVDGVKVYPSVIKEAK